MYITTLKYCFKKTVKSWGHLGSNIFEFWGVAGQAIPINDYVNPRAIITTRWHHRIRLYFFETAVQSFFWHISALESSFSTLNDLGWPWKWYQSIALIETHRMMGIWTLPEKKIFHLSEPSSISPTLKWNENVWLNLHWAKQYLLLSWHNQSESCHHHRVSDRIDDARLD